MVIDIQDLVDVPGDLTRPMDPDHLGVFDRASTP